MRKKFCITPVNIYNKIDLEQWLYTNANNGLYPAKIGAFISAFNSIEEAEYKFYLEPRVNKESEPVYNQYIDKNGWTYVCPVAHTFFLFSSKIDVAAPDDEIKLEQQIQKWQKETKRDLLVGMIISITILLLSFGLMIISSSKYDIQNDWTAKIPLMILRLFNGTLVFSFISLVLNNVFRYFDSRALPNDSTLSIKLRNFILIILYGLVIFCGINDLMALNKTKIENFEGAYIHLSEIEQVPLYSWEELPVADFRNKEENQVEYISSLLAPKAYIVYQKYYETTSTNYASFSPEGAPSCYSPSLDAAYFYLISSLQALPTAKAQMDNFRLVNLLWHYREVDYEGLDFVILAQADATVLQMAALGKGNKIAVFRYAGLEKLEDHIDKLAEFFIS